MKGSKVGKIVAMVFAGIFIAATMGLVLGLGLQWLWNQLMPEIFGLPTITYWQAVGLFVLSHLLFKGHQHCGSPKEKRRPQFGSKWKCDDEERKTQVDPMEEKIRRLLEEDKKSDA